MKQQQTPVSLVVLAALAILILIFPISILFIPVFLYLVVSRSANPFLEHPVPVQPETLISPLSRRGPPRNR